MTTKQITPPDAVLVAIDIAKGRNEVLIEIPGRHRRRKLSIRTILETTMTGSLLCCLRPAKR